MLSNSLGQILTIPVKVQGFNNISGYQFTLNWNSKILKFRAVNHKGLEGIYGIDEVKRGKLTAAWVDMLGQGVTLSNGTLAFELEFEVVGELGNEAGFEITSDISLSQAFNNDRTRLGVGLIEGNLTSIDPFELKGYKLSQNMPNPFSGATTIAFSLGQPEDVSIEIYNITGQLIKHFEQRFTAGSHEISWNGQNESGFVMSEGVYIAHLKAGGYVSSIRMMKVK